MENKIIIKGAREHNLKNINLELPKNKMIVFTGVSGSGKSSLAFDTIFAEGQRRYIESLSSYARQFLGQKDKPDVDSIEGLSPSVSIDQKGARHNPRSTIATITEIYDYLRVLFARIGKPHCPSCSRQIDKMTVDEMTDRIKSEIRNPKSEINPKSKTQNTLTILAPVVRGRKGQYHQLLNDLYLEGFSRVRINGRFYSLSDQVPLGRYKKHTIELLIDRIPLVDLESIRGRVAEAVESAMQKGESLVTIIFPDKTETTLSGKFTCPHCSVAFVEIEPRLFSFNSPYGACSACNGLGVEGYWTDSLCSVCNGARLKPESLAVRIDRHNIVEVTHKTIQEALEFFRKLKGKLTKNEQQIADRLLSEIVNRLTFLVDVGLDYLTLDRHAGTLSGGEAQRIRLASQVGSRLTGVLYVLDEPTIGLHQRDNERLVKTLLSLRDLGNTVIVVEHDEETILSSDHLVDIGHGAGVAGGHIVVADALAGALKNGNGSLTVKYLNGEKNVPLPSARRQQGRKNLKVSGARVNNLKNISVEIPLGLFVCVTGVSGSGKSTLLEDVIFKGVEEKFQSASWRTNTKSQTSFRIEGANLLNRVLVVDQSPIGRTPRSNPATYTGAFTPIRELFTSLPASRERGYSKSRFSFNVSGGRCEACRGDGLKKIEMLFLPDVYVDCDICKGKRFASETLEVKYNGKNIYDALSLTVDEALEFFADIYPVTDKLQLLQEVGLGYLTLGQPAPTLSGGEAQRVKLSCELAKRTGGKTLYLFDEPTVGLHFEDVKKLLKVLHRLVDAGNTVVVIEHNLDVIKQADWIIDLGPEGGDAGGEVVAIGPPEHIVKVSKSYTGRYLKPKLDLKIK